MSRSEVRSSSGRANIELVFNCVTFNSHKIETIKDCDVQYPFSGTENEKMDFLDSFDIKGYYVIHICELSSSGKRLLREKIEFNRGDANFVLVTPWPEAAAMAQLADIIPARLQEKRTVLYTDYRCNQNVFQQFPMYSEALKNWDFSTR